MKEIQTEDAYQQLKHMYADSGDLASALLPFLAETNDIQLAATMLHSQIEDIDGVRTDSLPLA